MSHSSWPASGAACATSSIRLASARPSATIASTRRCAPLSMRARVRAGKAAYLGSEAVAGSTLRVDVLGPLRVRDHAGNDLAPDGALQRRLFALLVLRRGHVVSAD